MRSHIFSRVNPFDNDLQKCTRRAPGSCDADDNP
jgi:hypothetical protein